MRVRVSKIDEYQFLTCVKHSVWGSQPARFKDWKVGDYLLITVDKTIAGLAEVTGEPYTSKKIVWDNGLFPNRINIKFIKLFLPQNRIPLLGEIRDALTSAWGTVYGWGIRNQQVLEGSPAETIVKIVQSKRNDYDEISSNLDRFLDEAKSQRDTDILPSKKRKKIKLNITKSIPEENQISSKKEDSAHSKAQNALIQLGKTTGCSVWIASNDRNRLFKGKPLGDGCLKSLPNLGLSEEAIRRISLIDTIWIRQSAPICAFEVETTTSIYSGLLRMSDLISVIPALNIKLYIVAQKERQDKVMSELSRPTFRKIGLNEFCSFISIDDLEKLLAKVEGLEGSIQPNVVDRIAFELEEDENSVG